MKLFIDTADVAEIREAASWGVLDGVTTNPSLVAKTGRDFETVLHEICALVDGPVSAEVVSTDAPGMVEEGVRLSRIHKNIVVKCPMIPEGLQATRPFAVLQQLVKHPLTDVGLERFLADWKKAKSR